MSIIALLCLAGCRPLVQSALIETDELRAHYEVHTNADDTTRASAIYRWDSETVILDDGDRVSVDDGPLVLEIGFDDIARYVADVPAAPDHVFTLHRGDVVSIEHRIAPASNFTLTNAPLSGTYDLEATLTWAPVRPETTISIVARSVACRLEITFATRIADTGPFAFNGVDLRPAGTPPPACTFEIEVTRTESTVDKTSGLESVTMLATRARTTTVSLR